MFFFFFYFRLYLFCIIIICRVGKRCLGSIVPVPNPPDVPLENEPVLGYTKGSKERAELEKVLDEMASECTEVPLVIGDKEIKTDLCKYQVMVRIIVLNILLRKFIRKRRMGLLNYITL